MPKLLIIGAGGHGGVVAELAELSGFDEIAFLDDKWPEQQSCGSWPIIGKSGTLANFASDFTHFLIAIGHNGTRLEKYRELIALDHKVPLLRHPSAIVSKHAVIGRGAMICAGAIVGFNVRIGDAVILNTACSVDHDCEIGDGVHISPGAHLGGNTYVGARSWIGIGSSVREGVHIGQDVVIGAGAAVVRDIGDGERALGVPAHGSARRGSPKINIPPKKGEKQ